MPAHKRELQAYYNVLFEYLQTHSEEALYQASLLSEQFIQQGVGPEEITAVHFEALQQVIENANAFKPSERVRMMSDAHQFLLEVMINYGVKYKEYLDLRLAEGMRDAEARLEQERLRAEEAERVQRERAEILASIAHELRTPLTVASGNVAIAVRMLSQGDPGQVSTILGNAQTALDRLSRLSGDLVALSKGEVTDLELEPTNLTEIVAKACQWGEIMAAEKKIVLIHERSDDRPIVSGNGDALLTVLGNLLSNAIRYTPEAGHVVVKEDTRGHNAIVEVVDDGIGIDPDSLPHIFDKFYRGPDAQRVAAGGLGLGLAIARQFVEAHGGSLEAESKFGQGSVFRVALPLLSGAPEEATDESSW